MGYSWRRADAPLPGHRRNTRKHPAASGYIRQFSHSHGRCYRKVKDALAAHAPGQRGLIPRWYSGVAARTGRDALQSYGFVNLLETEPYKSQIKKPSQAPKGAVLVYSSGVPCRGTRIPDCGHIEIKTGRPGNNAFVSDYSYPTGINETPAALRFGSRYKLIGVMIKPTN